MQKYAALLAIIAVIAYGIYNARTRPASRTAARSTAAHAQPVRHTDSAQAARELEALHTPAYTRSYIERVIVHGSDTLHFNPHEVMEPGFASAQDAPAIACYVMTLRGERCTDPRIEQAEGFFTSICGGCHGNDGRGTSGAYPDLTRRPLLGIAQRERFLRNQLRR